MEQDTSSEEPKEAKVLAPKFQLPEKNIVLIKEAVFGFFVVFTAIATGYSFSKLVNMDVASFLRWPPDISAYYLLPPLSFTVLFCLFILLAHDMKTRVSTLFFSAGALHVFFPFQTYYIGSIALTFLFFLLADWESKTEYAASTKVYIRKVAGGSLGYFFTGVALAMSFLYFSTIPPNTDALSVLLPKPLFEAIIVSMQGPLASLLPGVGAHTTIDDFLTNSLKAALEKNGQAVPDALLRQEVVRQREEYAKNSGMKLNGSEEVVDVLYNTARKWAADHAGPYARYIPAVLAVGYFITLKAISVVYYYVALFLAYIVNELMIVLGLFKRYSVAVEKEVLTF